MENDIKYIDELTNNALKNYTEEPISSWNNFNKKFGSQLKPNNFIINLGLTKILIAIMTFSIVSVGIFYYQSSTHDSIIIKNVEAKNNLNDDNYKAKTINKREKQEIKSEEKTLNTKKSSKIANKKDVIVKVKIPIHKKVEVRKQIIIKDSTN